MPKPSIEYLNARRAILPASGGTKQDHRVKYCPDRDLDLWERTDMAIESAWSDYRINAQGMWDRLFERAGIDQGYDIEGTLQ